MAKPTMVDGKPLFSSNHKNLLTGATSTLSADSLKKAIKVFLDQTDADGQPVNMEPSILLIPTALKFLAVELTRGAALMMSVTAPLRVVATRGEATNPKRKRGRARRLILKKAVGFARKYEMESAAAVAEALESPEF